MNKKNTPTVSVKIMEAKEISFQLNGNFSIISSANISGKSFIAKTKSQQLVIDGEEINLSSNKMIELKPQSDDCYFELLDVTIGVDFHWQQTENQKFKGRLKLLFDNDSVLAINIIDVEEYLKCVISSEMRGDSSLELLKAHSVVSRSWLFAQIEKQKVVEKKEYHSTVQTKNEFIRWYDREDHTLFDVCADDHCQRYQGITKSSNPNVEKAINETRGQVLKSGGKTCDTRYSKSCGGHTESFENVWEPTPHPYLQKVIDDKNKPVGFNLNLKDEKNATEWIEGNPEAFCNTDDKEILTQVLNDYDQTSSDFYRWEISYMQHEIAEIIKQKSGINFGQIIDLKPIERGDSGRLIKLQIVGTKNTWTVGKELEIRRWLSKSHLYSSAFIVKKETITNGIPSKFVLKGAGWGHGVGLCQIGAAVMGQQGYNYKEILDHYFKNAELVKIY